MLKKTELKIKNIVSEMITEALSPEAAQFNEAVLDTVHRLLNDDEFLRKIGKAMDVAEAVRISGEVDRNVEAMTAKEIEMSKSSTAWFEWVCLGVDPVKGEKMQYAYNDAFVKHMKSIGITGETPDDMFLRYVGLIGSEHVLTDD